MSIKFHYLFGHIRP